MIGTRTRYPSLNSLALQAPMLSIVSMAVATRKLLFLQCRDAFTDFHDMLVPVMADGARGVVHCFTGNRAEAEAFNLDS